MFAGYNRIFWGFIIMSFRINIGFVKILPPFVGLIVIGKGIKLLYSETQNSRFKEAKTFILAATISSVLSEIADIFSVDAPQGSLISVIWIVVYSIFEMLSIFKILEGTIEVFELQGNLDLIDKYTDMQRRYTIFSIINMAFISLSMIYGILWLKIASTIVAIGIRIDLLVTMAELGKLYKPEDPDIA